MLLFEWMARAALLAGLVGLAAWSLEELLRSKQRASRLVWVIALLISTVLPLTALFAPDLWPTALQRSGGVIVLPDIPAVAVAPNASATVLAPQWSARDFALGLWFAATLLLMLRWLHGWQKLRTGRARWREAILAGERVLISEDLGPAVVGLRAPRVVIPSWLLLSDAERQRMIVRHEVEHTRGGDQWLLALTPLLVALFPWNPVLWWQLHRLRVATELDCDARVLRGGVPALEYGSMLLDIAGGTMMLQPNIAALSEPRTSLERRIRAMTPIRYRHAAMRAASFAGLSVLALAAAVVAGAPTAPPVIAQERTAPVIQQEPRMLFVVDGKLLPAGAKLDLTGVIVKSIDVLKPADAVSKFGERGRAGALVVTTTPQDGYKEVVVEGRKLRETEAANVLRDKVEAIGPRATVVGRAILENGQPAAGAYIQLGKHSTIADADGRYTIPDVPVGESKIAVRTRGFSAVQAISVANANGTVDLATIQLKPMTDLELNKFDGAMIIDGKSLERSIPKAKLELAEAGAPQPLIVIDDVVVGYGKQLFDRLNPDIIESIDITKGQAALRLYGEAAAGGVIHIRTKK